MKIKIIAIFIAFIYSGLAFGNPCEEGLGEGMRPDTESTNEGTVVGFRYNLANEEYYITIKSDDLSVEIREPFELKNCLPAKVKWSTKDFIILEQDCGAPCWYVDVISVASDYKLRRVWYPLDFDNKELIVRVDDGLTLINIVTGKEQKIANVPSECQSAFPGSCFDEVKINDTYVSYKIEMYIDTPIDPEVRTSNNTLNGAANDAAP